MPSSKTNAFFSRCIVSIQLTSVFLELDSGFTSEAGEESSEDLSSSASLVSAASDSATDSAAGSVGGLFCAGLGKQEISPVIRASVVNKAMCFRNIILLLQ